MIYFVAGLAALTALGAGLGWIGVAGALSIIGILLGGGLAASHYKLSQGK